jgi:hypothetical protein
MFEGKQEGLKAEKHDYAYGYTRDKKCIYEVEKEVRFNCYS